MKRIMSLVLAILMVSSLFVGCGKKDEVANTEGEKSKVEETKETKETEKKEEQEEKVLQPQKKPIHVLMNEVKPGWPESLEQDIIRQYVQEKSGIEYEIEAYTGQDYDTKLNLLLASGEYPDIWYGSSENVSQWKKTGTITQLDDLYRDYGKDLKNVFHDKSLEAVKLDGELWSLPQGWNQADPTAGPLTEGLVIRKDWLDNVGLEQPETLEDYYNVLVAFTDQDPDGNGKKDTYGLTGIEINFNHIYNAFGVNPGHWYEREGKLVIGEMTDEFKEAVLTLSKWYKEGLIDPEFPVYTKPKQAEEKIINSIAGSFTSHVWNTQDSQQVETALREFTPDAQLVMNHALIGKDGIRGYRAPRYNTGNNLVISSQAEQPELIMSFLNWYAQDENYLVPNIGIENEHWKFKNDEHTQIERLGDWKKAKVKFTIGIGNPNKVIRISDRRHSPADLLEGMAIVTKYTLDNQFEGTVPAMSKYTDLRKMLDQTIIRIILGEMDGDDFDEMRDRWYKSGGQEITDQVNQMK